MKGDPPFAEHLLSRYDTEVGPLYVGLNPSLPFVARRTGAPVDAVMERAEKGVSRQ